jgi:hypothetical protein
MTTIIQNIEIAKEKQNVENANINIQKEKKEKQAEILTEIKIYEKQPKKAFSSKDDLLMESLTEFFTNKNHLNQMLPIVTKRANISLRILDWFVTNYAKEVPIVYNLNDKIFNVYNSYKDQLTAYSKKRFDPFRRRCQKEDGQQIDVGIKFWYTHDKFIETTVGQLNFFKWSIEKNVLAYVVDNLADLVDKMLIVSKTNKKDKVKKDEKENTNTNANTTVTLKTDKIPTNKLSSPNLPTQSAQTETYTNLTFNTDDKTGDVAISATKMITKKENVKIVLSFN